MYGISVVRRSIELVNIFRAKANESDIRRELSRAEEMDWSKGSGGTTWDVSMMWRLLLWLASRTTRSPTPLVFEC